MLESDDNPMSLVVGYALNGRVYFFLGSKNAGAVVSKLFVVAIKLAGLDETRADARACDAMSGDVVSSNVAKGDIGESDIGFTTDLHLLRMSVLSIILLELLPLLLQSVLPADPAKLSLDTSELTLLLLPKIVPESS